MEMDHLRLTPNLVRLGKTWLCVLLLLSSSILRADLDDAVAAWTDGPFVAFVGDSIVEGYPLYHSVLHGGPSGNTNYNIASVLYVLSTNLVTGTNYGYPSRTFTGVLSGDADSALANKPKYLLTHCGVNDIDTGRTWANVEADLNTLLAKCVASNAVLVIDEIFPWSNGSDAEALTTRTWNTNLHTWCGANDVRILTSHDLFGTNRPSTSQLDNLSPTYTNGADGIHLGTAGYTLWAQIILTNLVQWEDTAWFVDNANTGSTNGMSWETAWNKFSDIQWASIEPGDTIYISGGTSSKIYTDLWQVLKAGTVAEPIYIRLGQDSGHNGIITLSNSLQLTTIAYSNVVMDFGRSPSFSTNGINPVAPWGITNNIGLRITPAEGDYDDGTKQGIKVRPGLGVRIKWVEIRTGADANAANYGIVWDIGDHGGGVRPRWGSEIGYCWIHHNTKDGIYDAQAAQSSGMGGLVIHHCIIMYNADDGLEGSNGIDICYNRMGEPHPTYNDPTAHPDTIQLGALNCRIYNNLLTTVDNSAMYCLPLHDWGMDTGGNRYFYGNVVYGYSDTGADLINFAPRNYNGGTPCVMQWTNIVFVNNTSGSSSGSEPGIKWGSFVVDNLADRADSTYQTMSNAFMLNNVIWRVCQGLTTDQALQILAPCDVDYNTIDTDGGIGSSKLSILTNLIHHDSRVAGEIGITYSTPELYNVGEGTVSNMTATVTFANTNLAVADFRLTSADTGARNKGLNLSTYLPSASVLAFMPDYNVDMLGAVRGSDGTWDRGAFEYVSLDSGLLVNLTFENNFDTGQIDDQSGNSRHMLRYGFAATPTNWPTRVIHTNQSDYAAFFQPYYDTLYPPGNPDGYTLGDYGAITNLGVLHTGLTQMTVSVWCYYYAPPDWAHDGQCTILDANWGDNGSPVNGGWTLGRDNDFDTYGTGFQIYTNAPYSGQFIEVMFPDNYFPDRCSYGYHHYLVTVDCSTHELKAYWYGTNCASAVIPSDITQLVVQDPIELTFPWLAVGCSSHCSTPSLDDALYKPNNGWFHGQMDDLRIYDRVLTASEILQLAGLGPAGSTSVMRVAGTVRAGKVRTP